MVGEPAKPWADLGYPRAVVATGEILVKLLAPSTEIAGLTPTDFAKAANRLLRGQLIDDSFDWAHLSGNTTSIEFQNLKRLADAIREGARLLAINRPRPNFQEFVEGITANGGTTLLRGLHLIALGDDQAIAQKAQGVLDALRRFGVDPGAIANDTSDKLTAFFVDGTYNFTYILFPSVVLQNGAAGSGTCVISSNYDVNTKLLDKKSLINNFLDPLPQTILQSFDIHSNSIVMDTYGTSLSGKFGIKEDGSALNTVETGYDATYGTFTKFHKFYIKTQIGFLISNYNKDTDELHSVWFYSIVPKPAQLPDPYPGVKP